MASRSATAFDSFEVTGPDGKRLRYIGFDGQVIADRIDARPFSTVTIADSLDLTDKYLFQKAGRYTIRFNGTWTGLSNSPAITIEITAGRLSDFDDVASSLLPVCPDGWHLAKDGRGSVTPSGRSHDPSFALHLCHDHMRGEAVQLWFKKEEWKIDPNQPPLGKIEYLGRREGFSSMVRWARTRRLYGPGRPRSLPCVADHKIGQDRGQLMILSYL